MITVKSQRMKIPFIALQMLYYFTALNSFDITSWLIISDTLVSQVSIGIFKLLTSKPVEKGILQVT